VSYVKHNERKNTMATYNLNDPGFSLVPFFQNRRDAMGFLLKVNANTNIILNVIIQKEDYASPDLLMDMLSVAVDSIVQNRPFVCK
jgi:hypothetical protein